MAKPLIGVLAVQGAFIEHEHKLEQLGAQCVELRQASDLNQQFDGIVLPGGESTVQGKLLRELGMFDDLQARIVGGIPVLATCAGMILLANEVSQGKGTGAKSLSTFAESVAGSTLHVTGDTPDPAAPPYFATMNIKVRRNAYGRQLGSFRAIEEFEGLGTVPMTFIRGPLVEEVGEGVEVLARVNGDIVAVRQGNQLALSFHPELDADNSIHQLFLDMVKGK